MSEEKEVYRTQYQQPPLPSQAPRLESRIRAQEQLNAMLHASLVELREDIETSFKQQVEYQVGFERRILAEMAAMEARILDAFKQLVVVVSKPTPPTSND